MDYTGYCKIYMLNDRTLLLTNNKCEGWHEWMRCSIEFPHHICLVILIIIIFPIWFKSIDWVLPIRVWASAPIFHKYGIIDGADTIHPALFHIDSWRGRSLLAVRMAWYALSWGRWTFGASNASSFVTNWWTWLTCTVWMRIGLELGWRVGVGLGLGLGLGLGFRVRWVLFVVTSAT